MFAPKTSKAFFLGIGHCFVAFLLIINSLSAQSLQYRSFSAQEGLLSENISAICQDAKGALWLGGNGIISRYDGQNFKNIHLQNELLGAQVTSIAVDKLGAIWFGTAHGVGRYFHGRFMLYSLEKELAEAHVNAVFSDLQGNVWIGTDAGLAVAFFKNLDAEKVSFQILNKENGLPENKINAITQDKEGKVYLATDLGVSILKADASGIQMAKNVSVWDGLSGNIVRAICSDGVNGIWAGTNNGLTHIEKDRISTFREEDVLFDNQILSLAMGKDGKLWMGSEKGLSCFFSGHFYAYKLNAQPKTKIECLFVDQENNLWAVPGKNGLSRFANPCFVSFSENDGLAYPVVSAMSSGVKGRIWLGTIGGGLVGYDGKKFKQYGKGLASKKINTVLKDGEMLWVGGDEGLAKFNAAFVIPDFKNINTGFQGEVHRMVRDQSGSLWLGMKDFIVRSDADARTNFVRYDLSSQIQGLEIQSMLVDKKNQVWVGTRYGGLYHFDGKKFVEVGKSIGISSDFFMDMIQDSFGRIYFGTSDGLFVYNPSTGNVLHIGKMDGLDADMVKALFIDKNNNIWVGTNFGLNQIRISEIENKSAMNIRYFGQEAGFADFSCHAAAAYQDDDGVIWWGTEHGFLQIDTHRMQKAGQDVALSIANIRIDTRDTVLNKGAILANGMSQMEIFLNATSLGGLANIQYRYKLEGFDKAWSSRQSGSVIRYANLPSGHYTLLYTCTNASGQWNQKNHSFSFEIRPPFWRAGWFLGIVFLIGVLVVLFFVKKITFPFKVNQKPVLQVSEENAGFRPFINLDFLAKSFSSVANLLHEKDFVAAARFLDKMDQYIKCISLQSQKELVTLQEEVDRLRMYLELEGLQSMQTLDYRLQIEATLNLNEIDLIPFSIQPYLEKAVSLAREDRLYPGKIEMNIRKENAEIICSIIFYGIGKNAFGESSHANNSVYEDVLGGNIAFEHDFRAFLQRNNMRAAALDLKNEKDGLIGLQTDLFIPIIDKKPLQVA